MAKDWFCEAIGKLPMMTTIIDLGRECVELAVVHSSA
jgi:hypothetical protein